MPNPLSCALYGCDDPTCGPCSVPRRFAHVIEIQRRLKDADGLREDAPALNGTKPSTLKKSKRTP